MQNFRLSTAHVKFHQILIGSFRWKYKKFQLKKYRGVMSHVTEAWCKIWRKTGMLFQKWQEFGEFWPDLSKASKICILIDSFLYKVYNVWLKKNKDKLSFMTLKSDAKFEEKLTYSLENDMRNLSSFHQSTQ